MLDTTTAAALLGLTRQRVRQLCASGDLLAYRQPDSGWVISPVSVEHLQRNRPARAGRTNLEGPAR